MAVDFAAQVYIPNYNLFARPIVITPSASQPGVADYNGRGIYSSQTIDVPIEDGNIFSDQMTIVDILEMEFPITPQQGDTLLIPADQTLPALGVFEITNTWHNGGGEVTLAVRKVVDAVP